MDMAWICKRCGCRMAGELTFGPPCGCDEPQFIAIDPLRDPWPTSRAYADQQRRAVPCGDPKCPHCTN